MKKWQCSVCKYVHTGETPPEKCPVCGVSADKFVPFEDDTAAEEPVTQEEETAAPEQEAFAADDTPMPDMSSMTKKEKAKIYAGIYSKKAMEQTKIYMEKAGRLMVKHHAHPMTVHLPNGVIPVIAVLFVLSWLNGSVLLAKAGFINLVFVAIALPVVGLTGFMEWKKKYNQALTTVFKIKISAAAVSAVCCIISLIWYLVNPDVLVSDSAWLFVGINLLMLAGAGVAGHIGGKLVFKE